MAKGEKRSLKIANYRLSKKAVEDIENIFRYTKKVHGVVKAEAYVSQFKQHLSMLASIPHLTPLRSEFDPPVHIFLSGNHYIVYLPDNEGIWIVRFLHERMDINRYL